MPKSKAKAVILQVLPSLHSGGVERGTLEVAKALIAKGHKAIVVSEGGALEQGLKSMGATHVHLPVASKNPWTIWRNSYRLACVMKDHKVDVVHARSRAPAWSAYWATKRLNIPFVTTFHGVYSVKGGFIKRAYNRVMLKGMRVIAISEFIKDHILTRYKKVDETTIQVIQRGVDLSMFGRKQVSKERAVHMAQKLGIEFDRQVILLPGRFTEWKGHKYVLEALRAIEKDRYICLFVGSSKGHSHYQNQLRKLVKQYDLQNNVCMLDHMLDMPALYYMADIVLSTATARPEAFGRISVEGQAMGKLVIATAHGGSVETIIDGKTGWLVEPGNIEILSKTLDEVLSLSSRKRSTIEKAARRHVEEHFSTEIMVARVLEIYDEVRHG